MNFFGRGKGRDWQKGAQTLVGPCVVGSVRAVVMNTFVRQNRQNDRQEREYSQMQYMHTNTRQPLAKNILPKIVIHCLYTATFNGKNTDIRQSSLMQLSSI